MFKHGTPFGIIADYLYEKESPLAEFYYRFPNCTLQEQRIAAGECKFSLAIVDEKVIAWGNNRSLQCKVPKDLRATQVSAGYNHSLALTPEGSVIAWGDNEYCQCNVPKDLRAIQVSASGDNSIALTDKGKVVGIDICWTWDRCKIPDDLIAKQISLCENTVVGIDNKDRIFCFGELSFDNSKELFVQVSVKGDHCLAINLQGKVSCFGNNKSYQCNVPKDLIAVQVSAGSFYSLALTPEGEVVAWGDNHYGQCNVPKDLIATQISAGTFHSLALTPEGNVVAWGDNTCGQCNDLYIN